MVGRLCLGLALLAPRLAGRTCGACLDAPVAGSAACACTLELKGQRRPTHHFRWLDIADFHIGTNRTLSLRGVAAPVVGDAVRARSIAQRGEPVGARGVGI